MNQTPLLTNSRMKYSRLIGALYLLGFIVYGTGFALVTSVIKVPDYLSAISVHRTILALGAFMMMLTLFTDVWRAILFYPILENHSKRTALIYLSAQIISVVFMNIGVLCLLMIVPLGQHTLATREANPDWSNAIGSLLTQANSMAYQIGQMSLAIGSGILWLLAYRVQLVPKFFAVWGIAGYAIYLVGTCAEVFGIHIGLFLSIPGGLFEIALPFWLFIRGFNKEAYGTNE